MQEVNNTNLEIINQLPKSIKDIIISYYDWKEMSSKQLLKIIKMVK